MLRYTEDHEWVRLEGDIATVGITDHAQSELGDIVFVELPEIGATVAQGGEMATVESVKAASDVFAPLDGEVIETNDLLTDDPALVNTSPEDDGWFVRIQISDPGQFDALLDEDAYNDLIG